MKVKTITIKLLKQNDACIEGIRFFQINKLEGFPVRLIPEIKGYYKGFVDFIREIVEIDYGFDEFGNLNYKKYPNKSKNVYDIHGNIIYKQDIYGNEYRWSYKYDLKGNVIYEKDFEGNEFRWEYQYDKFGNVAYKKDLYGIEVERGYDSKGNLMWTNNKFGDIQEYRYDRMGNMIYHMYDNGDEFFWEYGYDSIGNIIWSKFMEVDVNEHSIEYYPDGQLKRYDSLEIPFFDKNDSGE